MTRTIIPFALALLAAFPSVAEDVVPAKADGFVTVTDRDQFLSLVTGRELHLGRFGVRLNLLPDGRIEGRALGWGLDGSWTWQDGYFCREMDWSGYEIGYNCQLVEAKGTSQLRFTVDRGAGDSASFKLK